MHPGSRELVGGGNDAIGSVPTETPLTAELAALVVSSLQSVLPKTGLPSRLSARDDALSLVREESDFLEHGDDGDP